MFTRQNLAKGPRRWTDRIRERLPWKMQEIPADLILPIALATLAWFGISYVLNGEFTLTALATTLVASFFIFIVSFLIGRWFGRGYWPRHGGRLAERLVRSYARKDNRDLIITGRWDFRPTVNRRMFEAVMFMASVQVLLILIAFQFVPQRFGLLAQYTALLVSAASAVVLVPHWAFGRLGLRSFDKWQFTLLPVTREYSDRLKISNGALAVIVIGAGSYVLRWQGRTDWDALVWIGSSIVQAVLFSLITAASAVAFYQRHERRLLDAVAKYAVRLGARDGRGESHAELASKLTEERWAKGRVLVKVRER